MNNVVSMGMNASQIEAITLEQARGMTVEEIMSLGRYAMRQIVQKLSLFEGDAYTAWQVMSNEGQATHIYQRLLYLQTFGSALRKERETAKLTTPELAAIVGVSRRAVEKWESGDNYPVKENYNRVLEALPSLKDVPVTAIRDIMRPVGRTAGASSEAVSKMPSQPPRQESIKYPPLPPIKMSNPPEEKPQPTKPQSKADAMALWSKAVLDLKLSSEQASALKMLVDAGIKLDMTLGDIGVVVEKWLA